MHRIRLSKWLALLSGTLVIFLLSSLLMVDSQDIATATPIATSRNMLDLIPTRDPDVPDYILAPTREAELLAGKYRELSVLPRELQPTYIGKTTFSDDGTMAAFIPWIVSDTYALDTLYVVDRATDAVLFTTAIRYSQASFSPDGQYLAVSRCERIIGGNHKVCVDASVTVYETGDWRVVHQEMLLEFIGDLRFIDTTHLLVTGCARHYHSSLSICMDTKTPMIVLPGG